MSSCNKCNPPISGKQREYEKNTLSYKKYMEELDELEKRIANKQLAKEANIIELEKTIKGK